MPLHTSDFEECFLRGSTFVESFLDGFAFPGVFSRARRPYAPTEVFPSAPRPEWFIHDALMRADDFKQRKEWKEERAKAKAERAARPQYVRPHLTPHPDPASEPSKHDSEG